MFYYILDKDKNPVPCADIAQWGEWMFEKDNKKIVAQTHIGDVMVSTVFLGIDHNWAFDNSAPILFETMVFGGDKDLDSYQERYRTYKEAMEGHLDTILAVKRKMSTIPDDYNSFSVGE